MDGGEEIADIISGVEVLRIGEGVHPIVGGIGPRGDAP